jgi:hypothetical protein
MPQDRSNRLALGPGERINPFVDPLRPLRWRRPDASISPFAPPPYPWERAHHGFRAAYECARTVLEAGDAITAFADSDAADPALIAPDLFAAATSAAAHRLRDAIPAPTIPEAARAVALVA